jgi:hypothetical protein
MKSIVLILALIGIILLAVGYVKSNLQCPPAKIEYRYIDKTFEDEQDVQMPILSTAGMYSMFENDSPWIQGNSYASTDVKHPA